MSLRTEREAVLALAEVIREQLSDYLEEDIESIEDDGVVVDFPAVDQMKYNNMIYVIPSYAEFEELTTCSDQVGLRCSIFTLSKRDTRENLILKTHAYYEAISQLLRNDRSLSNQIDTLAIENVTIYPAVEANPNVVGSEMEVTLIYEKDY